MRIIAGSARGKKLEAPEGLDTRPTHDRTREALFNILQFKLRDARVLDLFAGSGALGLEAVSRGAQRAVFCDNSRAACAVIQKNAQGAYAQRKYEVLNMDAEQALVMLEKRGESFSLVLLDPPYGKGLIDTALVVLAKSMLLTADACIVCETGDAETFALPQGFAVRDVRKYGKNKIHFVEREAESE